MFKPLITEAGTILIIAACPFTRFHFIINRGELFDDVL